VRRRVVIDFQGNQTEYELAILIAMRQLFRGQVKGEVYVGDGVLRYEVETDHGQEMTNRD
jgi:hypothetical protein